jgi:hypothetical protein
VVEDANGVEGWAPGTRVHIFCDPSTGQGSWQQLLCARPEALSRVPEGACPMTWRRSAAATPPLR